MQRLLSFLLLPFICLSCLCLANERNDRLLVALLSSDELKGYWHIEHFPERAPLDLLTTEEFPLNASNIMMFEQPIRLIGQNSEAATAFKIKGIEVLKGRIHLRFSYAPEGISGVARYHKEAGAWQLIAVDLVES